jgi:hypothetical protein
VKYLIGLLILAIAIMRPPTVVAQEPAPPSTSVHTRARDGVDTTLDVEHARLIVPAGAVTPGAMIAFGSGGVPAAGGDDRPSGVIVSAAGGFLAPVVVLIEPTPEDRAALGSRTPALRATADGAHNPCASEGSWVACPVPAPGAYVLEETDEPPSTDPLVQAALASAPSAGDEGPPPLLVRLLIIAGAAIGGGAIAWWLSSRPRSHDREPAERT